jgi:hypothetical protein
MVLTNSVKCGIIKPQQRKEVQTMYATTLEKKITRYVNKFGVHRAKCTKYEFAYYPYNNSITFSILRFPEDQELIDHIKEKFDIDVSDWYFIFSLLHEIGHEQTLPRLREEDIETDIFNRSILSLMGHDNKAYFNLPTEYAANAWAVDYLLNHQQECWDFQMKCLKIIRHVYKKKSFPY